MRFYDCLARLAHLITAGVSNIRIDGRVANFELGQIPEHAIEMRAAVNFLVANYGRQKIILMPRSVPKIAVFEESARTLHIPGGVKMIQEYYRQMRKLGCNILAGEALNLSVKTADTISNYPLPELMDPRERFSAFTCSERQSEAVSGYSQKHCSMRAALCCIER